MRQIEGNLGRMSANNFGLIKFVLEPSFWMTQDKNM